MAIDMNIDRFSDTKIGMKYKEQMGSIMHITFPMLSKSEINDAMDELINKKGKDTNVSIRNVYKNKTIDTTLLNTMEYILSRDPIITAYGVMFNKPEESINPLVDMINIFLQQRSKYKHTMFSYPKGSELFDKYNLLQLLAKIDANGTYGAIGNSTCLYYNINTAASITAQGQSSIAVAGMAFESFLANNVKFRSLNEVCIFIDNTLKEDRKYSDNRVLDMDISINDCFAHLITTCGHGYKPDMSDLEVVWKMLSNSSQEDINRLFYKNNLFAFIENKVVSDLLIEILGELKSPFLNPNKPPQEIVPLLDGLWELFAEYVYYKHGYIDRIDRLTSLPRKCTAVIDTDSNFVVLDPWYQAIKNKVANIDMPIKKILSSSTEYVFRDDDGNPILRDAFTIVEDDYDFDFDNDMIVEYKRNMDLDSVIPEDGLRYAIINIMASCLGNMVNDSIKEYTKHTNSYREGRRCKLNMKNEFLFKQVLLTAAKKNYSGIMELQEGAMVPENKSVEIKGLTIMKSTVKPATKKALSKILTEDILKSEKINPMKIVRKLAVVEKQIFTSLSEGKREYYKPVTVKSIGTYDDPMRIFGIKAAYAWNNLTEPGYDTFDLETRNSFDAVKVVITPKTIEAIKDTYPQVYKNAQALFKMDKRMQDISALAIPDKIPVPEWVKEFIDYNSIINDSISNFSPILESLGVQMVSNNVNYTNILAL